MEFINGSFGTLFGVPSHNCHIIYLRLEITASPFTHQTRQNDRCDDECARASLSGERAQTPEHNTKPVAPWKRRNHPQGPLASWQRFRIKSGAPSFRYAAHTPSDTHRKPCAGKPNKNIVLYYYYYYYYCCTMCVGPAYNKKPLGSFQLSPLLLLRIVTNITQTPPLFSLLYIYSTRGFPFTFSTGFFPLLFCVKFSF